MSSFELFAILLVLTAFFGWINHRLSFLPHTIGLLVMGLGASFVVIGAEAALPGILPYEDIAGIIRQLNFQETVLDGMLAFLLFAGALHVDIASLRGRAWTVGTMATIGVAISTGIIGLGFWAAAAAIGIAVPLPWALVFGALISPTDPVAVLATLKEVEVPSDLQTVMTGETLFNDGVGVVLFAVLLAAAAGGTIEPWQIASVVAARNARGF